MSENEKKGNIEDDFWNLDEYAKKPYPQRHIKQFPKHATQSVSIESSISPKNTGEADEAATSEIIINSYLQFSDSKLSQKPQSNKESASDSTITRFIPPHKDPVYAKKCVLFEYKPENPLIKSVKVCSEKQGEVLFPQGNLFIRERRALLNRKALECPRVSYYSYSPRYSQMSRAQLSYYLWWRENARNGRFLKADESYIILYAYELATTSDDEDKTASLNMLCSLLTEYTEKEIGVVFRMMIRDLICDFCLVHGLSVPLERLDGVGKLLTANAFLPEFFIDLSDKNRIKAMELGLSAISMYDYRKSKFYSPESSGLFKRVMNGALAALISDKSAFDSLTSFTGGVYGCVTSERRPFARLINIVNRNIKLEISYYQIENIQSAVTDAMRYSENKLREHMGIKNKLHITAINPSIKAALDTFFEENYPAMPTVDRRRKTSAKKEAETHEYDRFYDVPKEEISPQRALEIERDSWSTTKILTDAFADENNEYDEALTQNNAPELIIEPINASAPLPLTNQVDFQAQAKEEGLFGQIKTELGDVADFIELCKNPTPAEQRKFAAAHSLSVDEIADRINECAANVFGDIVLEDVGGAYGIIEDYIDQF